MRDTCQVGNKVSGELNRAVRWGDTGLLEIDTQIECLGSLLQKNEVYGNRLRVTLAEIQRKQKANVALIQRLNEQKEGLKDHQRGGPHLIGGQTGVSMMQTNQQVQSLYGHRISVISFYQYEEYSEPDCVSAFQLITRKKGHSTSLRTSTVYADNSSFIEFPVKAQLLLKEFFDKSQSNKSSDVKIRRINHRSFSGSDENTEKKEFASFVIINFFKEIYGRVLDSIPLTTHDTLYFNYIDWIDAARKANSLLRCYILTQESSNTIKYSGIDGIDMFNAFKQLVSIYGMKQIAFSSKTVQVGKICQRQNLNLCPLTQSVNGFWSPSDDEKLNKAVGVFGEKRWGQVSTQLNGKEHSEIVQRWVKHLNPKIEKGRWTLREDVCLVILHEFYLKHPAFHPSNKTWCLISTHFSNRTEVQIRERWCNLLDPKMRFTSWTKGEDSQLLKLAVTNFGQWAKISRHLENKTDNQVLRRWKLLMSDRFNANLLKARLNKSLNLTKLKDIFCPIYLTPTLADKVRCDNTKRREKKIKKSSAHAFRRAQESNEQKEKTIASLIASSSHIDSISTVRGNDDGQDSHIDFTDYQTSLFQESSSEILSCYSFAAPTHHHLSIQ